ncbi:MAG TPA: peptide chain release factor 1 [Myxococcaceae bacterium]|nr:peptide chain release factor 1 [Myxococcaceae bacterium]
MIDKLEQVERRFERLTADLANPDVIADSAKLRQVMKERASLEKLVETFREYRQVLKDVEEHEELLSGPDKDMRELAREGLSSLKERRDALAGDLQLLLLPKDPNDEKDVIVEIRAGAGGDEAALFAEELMQMYLRFADEKGWKAEILDLSGGNQGGVKEVSFTLSGEGVYSWMKYESGVHRVQRVPATEAQGRIHTSTVTVAVMPEAEEVDIQINPADIEMQVMRSTGSGGQSVNTTDSAVRLIHHPSKIVVKCQQEKSQVKNRAMAMKMLRTKLYELEQERIRSERDTLRKGQVGTGDRSEKIRTYNFPQDRMTDHRIGYTRHNLAAAMAGQIEDVVTALRTHYQAEALRQQTGGTRPDGR